MVEVVPAPRARLLLGSRRARLAQWPLRLGAPVAGSPSARDTAGGPVSWGREGNRHVWREGTWDRDGDGDVDGRDRFLEENDRDGDGDVDCNDKFLKKHDRDRDGDVDRNDRGRGRGRRDRD